MGAPNLETERLEIPCSACGGLILKQATKCKHCGEIVGQNKKVVALQQKSVGLLLGAGILLAPYLFAWLTHIMQLRFIPVSEVVNCIR